MTPLELFASCFPIIPEDVKNEFLLEQNRFGSKATTLHIEHHVIVDCDELEEFITFYKKEYNVIPNGGAFVFDDLGRPTQQVLYVEEA